MPWGACRATWPSGCAPETGWTFCRPTAASHRASLPLLPGPMWRLRPVVASPRCYRWCARCSRAAGRAAGEAEVTIVMDGRRRAFSMKMDDETVLDAAARAGIELPFSCRAGVCSTCRTKVVRGEVAMAQNYALEDWELEQGYVLACQSRVRTASLELDYDEK